MALAALEGPRPYGVPLLDSAWLWLERGHAPGAARGPGAALGQGGRAPRPAADHRGGRARARPALRPGALGPQLPAGGHRRARGGARPARRDGAAMARRAGSGGRRTAQDLACARGGGPAGCRPARLGHDAGRRAGGCPGGGGADRARCRPWWRCRPRSCRRRHCRAPGHSSGRPMTTATWKRQCRPWTRRSGRRGPGSPGWPGPDGQTTTLLGEGPRMAARRGARNDRGDEPRPDAVSPASSRRLDGSSSRPTESSGRTGSRRRACASSTTAARTSISRSVSNPACRAIQRRTVRLCRSVPSMASASGSRPSHPSII